MLEQEKKDLEAQLVTLTVESRVGNQEHIVAVPEGDGELQGQVGGSPPSTPHWETPVSKARFESRVVNK